MTERVCATCQKGEFQTSKDCPTRIDCFFPDYKNWEEIGEKEDDSCEKCKHWSAINIGAFCPNCGQVLN